MIARLCHEILAVISGGARARFKKSCDDLESTQRLALKRILDGLGESQRWRNLKGVSYEKLSASIPISSYEDYAGDIEHQRKSSETVLASNIVRFEPTSGSTGARKWIPYSAMFLSEMNHAAMAWLGDVYKRFPEVRKGTHYWSLSWLPEELRGLTSTDDVELFPWGHRLTLHQTMAVSPRISLIANPEAAWWATLLCLASREDLALVSVWSPTFWLKICSDLQTHADEITQALTKGEWGRHEADLAAVMGKAPRRVLTKGRDGSTFDFRRLWPKLHLISAWDSSSSATWSKELRALFPHVNFQGKGLWATEGVVTIPFEGRKVLSITSHFYEFIDLQTREILPAWQLQKDREYQPLLWTSSGLLRYALPDRLRLTEFFGQTPCFEFIGRLQSVDLVGEKVHADWVQQVLSGKPEWQGICLVACQKPKPHYVLMHQGSTSVDIEAELLTLHHYALARELGQLEKARSHEVRDVFEVMEKLGHSQILGQNKIEVLIETEKL